MLTIGIIIGIIATALALVRQFQMLQQNSYFAKRYVGWLKSDFSPVTSVLKAILAVLAVCGLFLNDTATEGSLLIFAAVALYFGWKGFKANSASVKKLVYTARIKRTFAFSLILLLVLGCGAVLFNASSVCFKIAFVLFVLIILFPEALCIISLFALKPCEKAISAHYINDAKRILKSVQGLKVIGITGSYGKTGTKYILSRILSEKYNVLHTPESYNTPMGVVRTVRENMRADTEIFVCEMGAKNIGDIKEICDIVHPNFGLITSVGSQHLESFKSIDNVFKTKFELFDAVNAKGGLTLANGDNNTIFTNSPDDTVLYGTDKSFAFRAENITCGRGGSSFDLVLENERICVNTKLLGRHNVLNIVGAAAMAYKLGVSPNDIAFAISRLAPTEHRLELKTSLGGSLLIDDAYNANPEGSIAAVNLLKSFGDMQKVIITPGLVELGEKEYEYNKQLGKAAAEICDIVILVGKKRSQPLADGINETEFNQNNLYIAASFKEAMEIYSRFADRNTVVLLENDLPDNYLK